MKKYDFKKIEKKWQNEWEKSGIYHAKDFSKKEKFYCLIEFPYPSGAGLHTGHVRSHVAVDIVARKNRMQGKNVLYPIGWDAFGLPTENFAIKTKKHPKIVTKQNIANYTRQIKSYGPSFDWSREINTTDPEYYKWTQWIFLKLYNSFYDDKKNKARPIEELKIPKNLNEEEKRKFIDDNRMAYEKEMPINWCPSCKIGLANEEVVAGNCERCGAIAEKRNIKQWMLRITKYADRLIKDLDTVDYLEKIKTQQINWIGKSEGAEVDFEIKIGEQEDALRVFTTRPDTLFGCTYMVIAPEHEIIEKYKKEISNYTKIKKYVRNAKNKSDMDRTELNKEKTGIKIEGIAAINPANGKKIPVWVADYVLTGYGTGAIMAVPAHDERDFEFAKKFQMEIIPVIKSEKELSNECYSGDGVLINSDFINGLNVADAKKRMIAYLEKKEIGKKSINYKLRDWVFSRQHYWGEPIPIIKCEKCGNVPLKDKDLPLELPNVKNYEPTDTGESPLANIKKWTEVKCPVCGGKARRETDTMPNWAGSSWYFLRYIDPKNKKAFADKKKLDYWTPIDLYNGGMEHTTLHLLYSRFWHKFLFDLGFVGAKEPYKVRKSHGMIIAEDGQKMSKSKGNVINPDDIIKTYGADTLRVYEMFMGPYAESIPWSTTSLIGSNRFLERIWNMQQKLENKKSKQKDDALETLMHQTIKKIGEDIDELKFNTAVAQLMIFANQLDKMEKIPVKYFKTFIVLISPFAPHITEEIWQNLGHKKSIHLTPWPNYDPKSIIDKRIELVIQINGKLRDKIMVSSDISEAEAKKIALGSEKIQKWLEGKEPRKVIFVKGKLVSIVI
jgi:leucyl-tRNA synthetase